jgi:ABC-type Zn2+ transport system substrate-binding protein/surface adhesin
MSFLIRLLLALCAFAGMANGMVHKGVHDSHDECAAQHSHDHGDTQDPHDDGDGKDAPDHHDCCHFPSADFALEGVSAMVTFQPILVAIRTDVSLIPEEPVFALDKPPLI